MKVTSSSPCRIGFFGGGSDVGEYARLHGGVCINLAINIRQKITLDADKQEFLSGDNPVFFKSFTDLNVKHEFDGEIESGLGSSAALSVALVGATDEIEKTNLNKYQIAEKAWDIEVNKCGLFGGRQDQLASVFGGASLLLFEDKVYHYALPEKKIDKITPYMALFYLGNKRKSAVIQEGLRKIDGQQKIALDKIKDLAYEGLDAIWDGDIFTLGSLMDESWQEKKKSNKGVSNDFIGDIYLKARKNGALGGKICGSGGGGHMLFITENVEKLKNALSDLKYIPFEVDWEGLKVEVQN